MLRSALLAPVIAQLLMLVPVIVLWLRRPTQTEALDGFTVGALSALGFTAAMTLTELASRVQDGNLMPGSVLAVLASAVIRGLTVPLIAAATTGYVGTTLWSRRGARPEVGPMAGFTAIPTGIFPPVAGRPGLRRRRRLLRRLPPCGLSLAAVLAFAVLRVGLHHILLHEHHDLRTGVPRLCPHCSTIVPAMPFCPPVVSQKGNGTTPLRPLYGDGEEDGIELAVPINGGRCDPTGPGYTHVFACSRADGPFRHGQPGTNRFVQSADSEPAVCFS